MKLRLLFLLTFVLLILPTHKADARLTAECFVSPSDNVVPGEEVRWRVEPRGGEELYQFSWSGSEGLTGNEARANITYRTPGLKSATVTVTSGNESRNVTCSQIPVDYSPLRGACYVRTSLSQSSVITTYTADILGGSGAYTYSWSGTDGLNGSNRTVSHRYTTSGFKVATVNVSSGNKSLTLTCNTEVPEVHRLPTREVIFGCQADSDNFTADDTFRWESIYSAPSTNRSAREIYDDTSFRWEGSEDLDERGEDISVRYRNRGYKSVEHKVFDEHTGLRTEHICQTYLIEKNDAPERENRRSYEKEPGYNTIRSGVHINTKFNSCIVGAVAEGTEWEPHEVDIRAFRDEYLRKYKIGVLIEKMYDAISPGYALLLEKSDLLRMHVRTFLTPLASLL